MKFLKAFDIRRLMGWTPYDISLAKVFAMHIRARRALKGRPGTNCTARRAERRARRRAHIRAARQALEANPPGSKLLRRWAKNAGYVVQEGKDVRKPTPAECWDWYSKREEAQELQGHRGFRVVRGPAAEAVRNVA